ncbi:diguanylate cyclase [Neptuniibacter sp. 1_MG-2023]|uniref:GGDEF domain-containing protein n=1 Tax=Neptuniibacter sp. 1_MG-2023 TaxID=3062662 RepID=UPI0026E18202|nr:GGDEF domain-containing protein [Neptuniibacter sp. 1_MG-2023]MDO6593217.1 GGDEF domain-containing protein [Neptuniibacter sp. 1_MG-2023]
MFLETLLDVSSGSRHSRYFNQTRSYYLFRRVRIIALLLALVQPAWFLVDYFLLPEDMLDSIALARAVGALGCLFLSLWSFKRYSLKLAQLRLVILVILLSGFQTASSSLLLIHGYDSNVAGYHFFPFMIITMMAIFPLAISETLCFTLGVLLIEFVTQLLRGTVGDVEAINSLWLLSVLGLIAGWAAVNQLNMLLGLYRQATRDPLTGLSNRRQAMEQLSLDILQARERGQALSVLLFDLDKFKNLNDSYGHAAGDLVLKSFAKVMRKHARKRIDLVCRYGGEEFLMVLPGMSAIEAKEVAEVIRLACHTEKVTAPNGNKIGFTASIGIAELNNSDDIESLLKRSDDALYAAKDAGRDRLYVAT